MESKNRTEEINRMKKTESIFYNSPENHFQMKKTTSIPFHLSVRLIFQLLFGYGEARTTELFYLHYCSFGWPFQLYDSFSVPKTTFVKFHWK